MCMVEYEHNSAKMKYMQMQKRNHNQCKRQQFLEEFFVSSDLAFTQASYQERKALKRSNISV